MIILHWKCSYDMYLYMDFILHVL